jgi:hypothetical protein
LGGVGGLRILGSAAAASPAYKQFVSLPRIQEAQASAYHVLRELLER